MGIMNMIDRDLGSLRTWMISLRVMARVRRSIYVSLGPLFGWADAQAVQEQPDHLRDQFLLRSFF